MDQWSIHSETNGRLPLSVQFVGNFKDWCQKKINLCKTWIIISHTAFFLNCCRISFRSGYLSVRAHTNAHTLTKDAFTLMRVLSYRGRGMVVVLTVAPSSNSDMGRDRTSVITWGIPTGTHTHNHSGSTQLLWPTARNLEERDQQKTEPVSF